MADVIYNALKKNLAKGLINLETDTIKALLVTSAYAPDQDAHEFKSSVSNEVVGTGYVAGGATLAGKTLTQDNVNNKAVWDANDVVWSNSTLTARGAVIYKDTGVAGTSLLICYIDFIADKSSSNGSFTLQFHAAGILNLT